MGKKDNQLVLAILSKLGPDYSVFVSTFYAPKLTAQTLKMPSLAYFIESLTQEQDKLVMMGTIKPSKDQALIARYLKVDSKSKRNLKIHLRKRDKKQSPEEPQGSKKNYQKKKNKGEMSRAHTAIRAITLKALVRKRR